MCACVLAMAGGSEKKLLRENQKRISALKSAVGGSSIVHAVVRMVKTRSITGVGAWHSQTSWVFLLSINVGAWLAILLLMSVGAAGTSLTTTTLRGSRSTAGAGLAWWIEHLQDIVFLVAFSNIIAAFSAKMGFGVLLMVSEGVLRQ